MLHIEKKSMNTNTFEEACEIAFSKNAEVIKTAVFAGMGFGTIEVNGDAWDWKEEVCGFKFFGV